MSMALSVLLSVAWLTTSYGATDRVDTSATDDNATVLTNAMRQCVETKVHELGTAARANLREQLLLDMTAPNWPAISLRELERIRQAGGIVQIEKNERSRWLRDWVSKGTAWRDEEPYSLVLLLKEMSVVDADFTKSRSLLVDHLLELADARDASLSGVIPYRFARFVVYLGLSLQGAPRYADEQERDDVLVRILNGIDNETAIHVNLPNHWRPSERAYRRLWYGSYQLHSCGGSPSWGEGDSPETGWIADGLHEALLDGRLRPRLSTLNLLSWHFAGIDELEQWKAELDGGIGQSAQGSEDRVSWLLGRAYAEEITSVTPDPLRGCRWIRQAIDETADQPSRQRLEALLAVKLVAGSRSKEANALLSESTADIDNSDSQYFAYRLNERIASIGSRP